MYDAETIVPLMAMQTLSISSNPVRCELKIRYNVPYTTENARIVKEKFLEIRCVIDIAVESGSVNVFVDIDVSTAQFSLPIIVIDGVEIIPDEPVECVELDNEDSSIGFEYRNGTFGTCKVSHVLPHLTNAPKCCVKVKDPKTHLDRQCHRNTRKIALNGEVRCHQHRDVSKYNAFVG